MKRKTEERREKRGRQGGGEHTELPQGLKKSLLVCGTGFELRPPVLTD